MDIKYPEEHFSMDEDNLKDILNTLVDKSKDLKDVPISISLTEKYILGAVGKWNETKEFMKQLLLQIITFHSYEDVKFVFFIDEKHVDDWEYVKILPHTWSNDKQMRFFAMPIMAKIPSARRGMAQNFCNFANYTAVNYTAVYFQLQKDGA